MDFHSLTRKQIQNLCKKNKIPANLTNVAMADALKALHIVEGMEEILQSSESEIAKSSIESPEKLEVTSPSVPRTGCRTSTRRRVVIDESETSQTLTRTRRGRRSMVAEDMGKGKNDAVATPAVSPSSRRRAPAASACQKMDIQLKECEEEKHEKNGEQVSQRKKAAPETPSAAPTRSTRGRVPAASATQNGYGTRRSTRLFEKKMDEASLEEKEMIAPVKIVSFSNEENLVVEGKDSEGGLGEVIEEAEMSGIGLKTTSEEPLGGTNVSTDHSVKKSDVISDLGEVSEETKMSGVDHVDLKLNVGNGIDDGSDVMLDQNLEELEMKNQVQDSNGSDDMFHSDNGNPNDAKEICLGDNGMEVGNEKQDGSDVTLDEFLEEHEPKIQVQESTGSNDVFNSDTGNPNDEKEICFGDNGMDALDSVIIKFEALESKVENINEDKVDRVNVISEDSGSVIMISNVLNGKGTDDCALIMLPENRGEQFSLDFENPAAFDGCGDALNSLEMPPESENLPAGGSIVNDLASEDQAKTEIDDFAASWKNCQDVGGPNSPGKIFDSAFSEDESESNCAGQDLTSVIDQEHDDGSEMAGEVSIGVDLNDNMGIKWEGRSDEALDFEKLNEDVDADNAPFPCTLMLDEAMGSDACFNEEERTILNNVVESYAKGRPDLGSEVGTDDFLLFENNLGACHLVCVAEGHISGSSLEADPCQTSFNLMASGLTPTKKFLSKTPEKKSLIKTPTTIRRLPCVSDNKENNENNGRKIILIKDEEKNTSKKGRAVDELKNLSMRKLTKMLKELSISNNMKTERKSIKVAEARSPLRTLPENCVAVAEEK